MRVAIVLAVVVVAALFATVWPLLAYSTSLAAFGLTHVMIELRYVDARFGARFPRAAWAAFFAPIVVIVLLRAGALLDLIDGGAAVGAELALVTICLAASLCFLTWRRNAVAVLIVVVVVATVAVLAVASLVAPLPTLLGLAVAHNATPLGFFVERAPPGRRAATLLWGTLAFVGAPALVASGLPGAWLVDVVDLDKTWLPTGGLAAHYAVYLPPALRDEAIAAQLFSAAVTAQLLHYAAVIVGLPRTLTGDDRPVLPWPRWRWFLVIVAIASAGLLVHFIVDFKGARALYGLAAAVHAWIEWPVLAAGIAWSLAASPVGSTASSAKER